MFDDTNILRSRFKNSSSEHDTNSTLQNTSSLRRKDMECLKVIIDATTLQNTVVGVNMSEMTSGLKDSGVRNKFLVQQDKALLPHKDNKGPRKQELELDINDLFEYDVDNSFRKNEQNEQESILGDAVEELNEIISNSRFLYTSSKGKNDDITLSSPAWVPSQVWMNYASVGEEFKQGISSSPILRPQNPIPYHESFMNHDDSAENDTLFPRSNISSGTKLTNPDSLKNDLSFKERGFSHFNSI
ncbi:14416_t:CDS:2 [Funneliformis caledonium]|uniref:14416_t:CDS:1 n=1 Tax=Funneliformis caledonium TaxID=1117310 RepID=A0A9N9DPA3_9GLOM|nr:14416_t:CDS:2 [Funneliformis caledonium]